MDVKKEEYYINTTNEFDTSFEKLDNSLRQQIWNEINQLKINPFVGKPLGYKFMREKKVCNYRFYYLIYENRVVVFIVALSNKKDQQKIINLVKSLLPYYKEYIEKKYKQI